MAEFPTNVGVISNTGPVSPVFQITTAGGGQPVAVSRIVLCEHTTVWLLEMAKQVSTVMLVMAVAVHSLVPVAVTE